MSKRQSERIFFQDDLFDEEEVLAYLVYIARRSLRLIERSALGDEILYANSGWGSVHQKSVMSRLLNLCNRITESALLLLKNNKVWECDVLMRCVVEGTMKFVVLASAEEKDKQAKFDEYWDSMGKINSLRRSQRASDFLKMTDNPGSWEWIPFKEVILDEERDKEIREELPRQARKDIEHRWSFNEMAMQLQKMNPTDKTLSLLTTLSYQYGTASHLIHMDGDAVGMVWERDFRPDQRRLSVTVAHGSRVASDVISLFIMRNRFVQEVCKTKKNTPLHRRIVRFLDLLDVHQKKWSDLEYKDRP